MQLKQKLLNDKSTTMPPDYFIDRYNMVIETCNKSQGTENGSNNKLQYLDSVDLFQKFNRLLGSNIFKIILIVVLAFVPLVNLLVYGTFWFYFLFLRKEGKKHRRNLSKNKDPLNSYYFLPEVCQQLNKHCTTLSISPKQLEGFTFNENLHKQIKQRQKSLNSADKITVTIYDQYFYDSFHLLKKEQYKVGAWILLGTFLIAAGVLFYCSVFNFL